MLDIILWVIAAALMVIGFAGTIVPMIPGLPLIFAGAWLAAFIDHYDEISVMTLVILALIGIFTGLWGLIFMPLLGAAIGEFIDHRDLLKSGKVGFATWLGMMIGIVIKLGLAFTMIGIVIAALII